MSSSVKLRKLSSAFPGGKVRGAKSGANIVINTNQPPVVPTMMWRRGPDPGHKAPPEVISDKSTVEQVLIAGLISSVCAPHLRFQSWELLTAHHPHQVLGL